MTIEICSQTEALALAETARERIAVISITSTGDEPLTFPENPNIEGVLHLHLNDLVAEYDEEGFPYGRPLPKQADLGGLRAFVDGLSCERLIVHCYEGASRSAAVAAAICACRGKADTLRPGPRFTPNPLIYDLACRELGLGQRGRGPGSTPG